MIGSNDSTWRSYLPHNLALVSVLYSGERPELTSHCEKSKTAKTRKRKHEDKKLKTNMHQRVDRDCGFNRCLFLRFGSSARTNHVRTNHPRRVADDGYRS